MAMTRTIPIADRTARRLSLTWWRGFLIGTLAMLIAMETGAYLGRLLRPTVEDTRASVTFTPAPPGWEPAIPPQWQRAPLMITPRCQECLWL